jgi:7 transmembrane sweet-taste receptor of 3 GCPR
LVNVGALLTACYQAFKARNISDEFSESKNVGVALFSWLQLMLVGLPLVFLIADSNPGAQYILRSCLVFCFCQSMLLLIFVPMVIQLRKLQALPRLRRHSVTASSTVIPDSYAPRQVGNLHVSGINDIDSKALADVLLRGADGGSLALVSSIVPEGDAMESRETFIHDNTPVSSNASNHRTRDVLPDKDTCDVAVGECAEDRDFS